ncbi:MAG: glutamate racemase [Gammaproteobacteria bacterium]|nr:MAG: glutamate racemase [Gammaproteobacteria bacterium]PHR82461.1 MAG: glutamate racemase [Colwellia sp.]
MQRQKPIGIFDSGVGGLSIVRAIKRTIPDENLIYFADTEFSPYGNKTKEIINQRSEDIINFLINQGCKMVVMACNTATVNSINSLRSKFSIPIVGVEPAIKPAALKSKTGIIGILATEQTLESEYFHFLKSKYSQQVKIETKACPKLVSLVENLNHDNEQAMQITEQYIHPLLSKGCDQIVLGCTHFSFLSILIKNVVGDKAAIIDTAVPVAMEVKKRLQSHNMDKNKRVIGTVEFWTSGDLANVIKSISQLWEQDIKVFKAKI